MATRTITTSCCIAGGGPAGMMLGYLLARAGIDVVVLEKHADFLRDFRGDTIHPSTLELMHELALLDDFLRLPHQKTYHLNVQIEGRMLRVADFSHLPTRCGFVAFMPQWDFLDFLADQGRRYRGFNLHMQAKVTDLIVDGARIAGVRATLADGECEVRAHLVVGADGRDSTVRAQSGLQIDELGAPMDVLWFRLSRRPSDPGEPIAHFAAGHIYIMLNRGDYWQCGYVIPKGSLDSLRAAGLSAMRAGIVRLAPFVGERVEELASWDELKLLTVAVDRLRSWYRDGLLCIGDAAHAMSPIGGVGINLAVQDAVATANLLAGPLRARRPTVAELAAVQARRALATRVIQAMQLAMQERVVSKVLAGAGDITAPPLLRLIAAVPLLQRIPARVVGLGVRPEHIETMEDHSARI